MKNKNLAVKFKYPEPLPTVAEFIYSKVIEYYPQISEKTYDNYGLPCENGCSAIDRIMFCLYIELLKAGIKLEKV